MTFKVYARDPKDKKAKGFGWTKVAEFDEEKTDNALFKANELAYKLGREGKETYIG